MQLDFVLIYQHLYIYWTTEQILLAIFSATLQFFRVRGSWKHLQYREPTHVSSEKIKIIVVLGQVSNKTKRPELSRKQAVTILFDGSIKPHGQTSVNSISTTLHTNLRFSKKNRNESNSLRRNTTWVLELSMNSWNSLRKWVTNFYRAMKNAHWQVFAFAWSSLAVWFDRLHYCANCILLFSAYIHWVGRV